MKFLLKYSRVIDAVSEVLGKICVYLVLVLVFVGVANVLLRYAGRFTGSDLFGEITQLLTGEARAQNALIELQWYIYSAMFFMGFPYILKHNVNVRVDILYSRFSPRTQAWIDTIGTACFLIPFCLIGLYATIAPVAFSWGFISSKPPSDLPGFLSTLRFTGSWELSSDPGGLPRAPIKSFILVAFGMLLLQAIAQLFKYLAVATGYAKDLADLHREDTPEAIVQEVQERAEKVFTDEFD